MGKKKKFIDKKKSATFQLIARDTSDPNYNEGPSGDRVFVRVDENPYSVDSFKEYNDDHDSDSIFADASEDYDDEDEGGGGGGVPVRQMQSSLLSSGSSALPDHIRKEILELGFPDDGYNYLAHLREIKNTGGGSSYYENPKAKLHPQHDVKAYDASRIEISKVNDDSFENTIYNVASKTVGARIQKVVDPEVAALLDDSDLSRFGSDAEDLEEDFVVNANLPEQAIDAEIDTKLNLIDEPEVKTTENSGPKLNLIDEPEVKTTKSYGPKVSLSVDNVVHSFGGAAKTLMHEEDQIDEKPRIRRLLDEQFDLLELQEYGTDSEDEFDGSVDEEYEHHQPLAEKLNQSLQDHVKDELEFKETYKAPSDLLHGENRVKDAESMECAADVIQRCMEYAEKYENEKTDEEVVVLEESTDESEIWDCETIVSTYSNLDNHPGKIGVPGIRRKKKLPGTTPGAVCTTGNVISLKGKQQLPLDFLPHSSKSAKEKVKGETTLKFELPKRKQHGQESKEEKKERKVAVKEERREARRTKKEMKGLYKGEAQHAQKVAAFTGPSSIHLM